MSNLILPGRYRHFKGGLYDVIFNGKFEMDDRDVVVYQAVRDNSVWVRYSCYFNEMVMPGRLRFEYVGNAPETTMFPTVALFQALAARESVISAAYGAVDDDAKDGPNVKPLEKDTDF